MAGFEVITEASPDRRHVWDAAGEYVDVGWSGAKASRPEFDRLPIRQGDQPLFDRLR